MNQVQRRQAFDILSTVNKFLPQLERVINAVDGNDLHWEGLANLDAKLLDYMIDLAGNLKTLNTEILNND